MLDLCCGAGGFSLGFSRGNKLVGVDRWPVALETYQANIGTRAVSCEVINTCIYDLDASRLGKFDVVIMSPVCKGFSPANKNLNKISSKDFSLVDACLSVLGVTKPKWWTLENSDRLGSYLQTVTNPNPLRDEALVFMIAPYVRYISANQVGLYHRRRRAYIGNHPNPRLGPHKPVKHPTPIADEVKAFNKQARIQGYRPRTLGQKLGRVPHPWEAKILMGFPPDYQFAGTVKEQLMQIGNAVVPIISTRIHEAIRENGVPWVPPARRTILESFMEGVA